MDQREAFVLNFRTASGNRYLYDVASNLIFNAQDPFPDVVSLYNRKTEDEIVKALSPTSKRNLVRRTYKYVDTLVKNYACFFPPEKIENRWEIDRDAFNKEIVNLSSLTLEVTQDCNFRCRYCAYSGSYLYFRHHNSNTMTELMAKKSIDYFLSLISSKNRTNSEKSVLIGFYGGEPLLRFKFITDCIEYAKSKRRSVPLSLDFSVTTNGFLLTPDIVDYLIKNRVILHISIDGPQEIHNINRVLANGKGTFARVWRNISRIKEEHPQYYDEHVSFLVTFSKEYDLNKLDSFFSNAKYFGRNFKFNPINEPETSFYEGKKLPANYQQVYQNLYRRFKEYLINGGLEKISPLSREIFSEQFTKLNARTYVPIKKVKRMTAACFPGGTKLFVSSDGNFHICEKMNHHFQIGDYQNGISYERVRKIMADYFSEVAKDCGGCIALHYCPVCYVFAAKDGHFDAIPLCRELRSSLERLFTEYFSVLEQNDLAFYRLYSANA